MNNLTDFDAVDTFHRTIARIARRLKKDEEEKQQREGQE